MMLIQNVAHIFLFCFWVSYSDEKEDCPDIGTLQAQLDKQELYDAVEEVACITDEAKLNNKNFCEVNKQIHLEDFEEESVDPPEFDYVVIGGGRTGCVVANRLTEMPNVNVLVLERGNTVTPVSKVPAFKSYTRFTKYSKALCLEMQDNFGLALDRMPIHEGSAFGGTSNINANIYNSGNPTDYTNIECYDDIHSYIQKSEKANLVDGFFDSAYHNYDGLLSHTYSSISDIGEAFINCGLEQGYEVIDPSGNFGEGFYKTKTHSQKGKRLSHADAFLAQVLWRKNLDAIGNAYVYKILINKNLAAIGVKYIKDNKIYTALARNEVIIALSAYDAAKLLMISGIGPKENLEKHGIPCIKDLPVGKNLFGRIFYGGLAFETNCTNTPSSMEDIINKDSIKLYLERGEGPLSVPYNLEAVGNIAINSATPNVEYRIRNAYWTTDKGEVDIKTFGMNKKFYKKYFGQLESKRIFTIYPVLKALSSGRVKLRSNNPFEDPKVYGNYFSNTHDLQNIKDSIKFILNFVKCESFKKFGISFHSVPVPGCRHKTGDAYWDCAAKYLTFPLRDFSGTCKMGSLNDSTAVVDQEGKVIGIDNLRVTGRSIVPNPTFGGSNAVTTMLAERTSDYIKKQIGVRVPKYCP